MRLICVVDDQVRPHASFRPAHGLSILIETETDAVLFDTGPSGEVLFHNLEAAEVDPARISAVVLSHAHYDHTGGLPALLHRRPGLPLYAHPDLLRERFSERDGSRRQVGLSLAEEELQRRAELHLSTSPQEVGAGIWTSGEIASRPYPEGKSSHHFVRQGDGWGPDPYRDDLALILQEGAWSILVCGCCHAGLLNTLSHVREVWGRSPEVILGGTHLVNATDEQMRQLVEVLDELGPPMLYLNHCTGEEAYMDLAFAFGERVAPFPAGAVLDLRGEE